MFHKHGSNWWADVRVKSTLLDTEFELSTACDHVNAPWEGIKTAQLCSAAFNLGRDKKMWKISASVRTHMPCTSKLTLFAKVESQRIHPTLHLAWKGCDSLAVQARLCHAVSMLVRQEQTDVQVRTPCTSLFKKHTLCYNVIRYSYTECGQEGECKQC